MRFIRYLGVGTLAIAVASCELEVTNPNLPDRQRILASPADVVELAGNQFQTILSARGSNFNSVSSMMATAAFENTSPLANSGMGPKSAIPRSGINNAVGNPESVENFRDFRIFLSAARNAADIFIAMDGEEFALGTAQEELRLRSWTHFITGLAYGYISLVYDQTGIARPDDSEGFEPPLVDYRETNQYALEQFDEAIRIANEGIGSIPGSWLTGPDTEAVSQADYIRVIRTYRAHMEAEVARTPEERAAVNWGSVIANAEAGIQSDFIVHMNPDRGWDFQWLAATLHFRDANWHQMNYYIIGMADTSGRYDAWLAAHRDARPFFAIVTPDRRFPQGDTRDAQQRPAAQDDTPLPAGQYFRNRNPDKDEGSIGWQKSQYDHYRFRTFADANRIANFPLFTQAQNDLLRAEGYIRTNNPEAAVPLINRTRTAAGLPAVTTAGTSGAQCVPRVPAGPAPDAGTRCGNLMEAMMWERWIETAFTSYGAWFFINRGWGILPIGTAFDWPVPNQELDARQEAIYNRGGEGLPGGAAPSIYGFGTGPK